MREYRLYSNTIRKIFQVIQLNNQLHTELILAKVVQSINIKCHKMAPINERHFELSLTTRLHYEIIPSR